jgi:hypothetical protein
LTWGAVARVLATVFALGIVSLLNDAGGDAVPSLLPAFVATVGGRPEALGLIEGVADAAKSLVQFGYGIANSLRPLLSLATGWWQILVIRVTGSEKASVVRRAMPCLRT